MKILKGSTTLLPPPPLPHQKSKTSFANPSFVTSRRNRRTEERAPSFRDTTGNHKNTPKISENIQTKRNKNRGAAGRSRSSTAADAKTNPSAGKPKVKNRKRIPRTRPRSSRPPTARRVEGARVRSRSKCVSSSAETNISKLDFKKKNQTGEGDVKNHRADLGVVTRLQLSQKTKT